MTKTSLPCPKCHVIGIEVTDHIYCPACKRRFKLPVMPREMEIEQKVGSITFDYGDGTTKTDDLTTTTRKSAFGDEWR